MADIRISIVMTVFDSWLLFPRALACVLWQTFSDWELLVVSDGPSDPSVHEALRGARRLWRGHRVLVHECPRAPGCWGNRARKTGLDLAQGSHIVWFNHDNLIAPGYLAAHAAHFAENHDCVSLVGVDLWQGSLFRKRLPEQRGNGHGLRSGRVDLLNYALPVEAAREVDAFGPAMETVYAADWLTLAACLDRLPVACDDTVLGVHY